MSLSDERNMEIPDKRRFCFGSDGIERLHNIIPGGQVGKACGGAENGRVKIPGDQVSLRAVNSYSGNPCNWLAESKSVGALKGGRGRG